MLKLNMTIRENSITKINDILDNKKLSSEIEKTIYNSCIAYSNENNILTRLKSGNVNLINKKNHFFSRIHTEDVANILFKSLTKFKSGEIYNISDDKPSSSEELTKFAVKLIDVDIPKKIEINEIKSEMLKSFYKDSKKVNNKKMKNFFSYKLKFPTYVEGLNYIKDNFI